MNVTTIQIKWSETSDYYNAVNAIANSTLNTFESDNVKVETSRLRYTDEKLITALNILDCNGKRQKTFQNYRRFLIWRYVYSKFNLTSLAIANVTGHDGSAVRLGCQRISGLIEAKDKDVLKLRTEVYQVCDTIFI